MITLLAEAPVLSGWPLAITIMFCATLVVGGIVIVFLSEDNHLPWNK
jgi:hypothetical protein